MSDTVDKRRSHAATIGANGAVTPIGVVARRTGCSIDTIRFYEKIGVLPSPQRTESGRRVYGASDIARLSFICRARELGFSLDEIRDLLKLAAEEQRPCEDVKKAAIRHRQDVRRKISDLRAVEASLGDLIRLCRTGQPAECPLLDALSQPIIGARAFKAP